MKNVLAAISSRGRTLLPVALLVLVTALVFGSALGHRFLVNWDDPQYVVDNPLIRGLDLSHLKALFTSSYMGNYAPLHLLTYALEYRAWGLWFPGFVLTNLVLHAANAVLFFLLLRALYGSKPWIVAAALVFVAHPVQVESVVWVAQLKNLLAMLFFLLALLAYVRYRRSDGRGAGVWYAASLATCVLALLSKSVAVVLPVVLVLLDLTHPGESRHRGRLLDKVPFFVAAGAFALVAVMTQSVPGRGGGAAGYHGGTPYRTFLTMIPVLIEYVRLVLWPSGLSAYYDVSVRAGVDATVVGAALLWGALACLGLGLLLRKRKLFFWFALFFVGLLPVSQIVPIVTLMNDRYLYFPMLGAAAFLGAVVLGDRAWGEIVASRQGRVRGALVLLACCALAWAAARRTAVWTDSYTLWSDTVAKAPRVALTHDCLGEGLLQRGQVDAAIGEFTAALQLEPASAASSPTGRATLANTHNNLGTAFGLKGATAAAVDQFQRALQLNPTLAKAHFNLGNALMHEGRVPEALASFERAVRLAPETPAFVANFLRTRELLYGPGVPR